MQKETLSNYGWIVVVSLVMAVMLALATPFGTYVGDGLVAISKGYVQTSNQALEEDHIAELGDKWEDKFNYGEPDQGVKIETLLNNYEFQFYSNFCNAIDDINYDMIGDNADSDQENAIAGVYTMDDGIPCVVLFKDVTQEDYVACMVSMCINLGGHKLTIENNDYGVITYNDIDNITIDGRLKGSEIILNGSPSGGEQLIFAMSNSLFLNGGTYTVNNYVRTEDYATTCLTTYNQCNVIASHCKFIAQSKVTQEVKTIYAYDGNITLDNCKVYGYNNLELPEDGTIVHSSYGVQVRPSSTVTLNNCYVFGNHSAVTNFGTLYINGGTYEGVDTGIYASGSTSGSSISYIQNATMQNCNIPNGYTKISYVTPSGLSIGGNKNAKNIVVYVNNCKIYAEEPIELIGTFGEENNTLYISNSTINKDYTEFAIDIESNTHKVYIGKGCNFTSEDTNNPSLVYKTNEIYIP